MANHKQLSEKVADCGRLRALSLIILLASLTFLPPPIAGVSPSYFFRRLLSLPTCPRDLPSECTCHYPPRNHGSSIHCDLAKSSDSKTLFKAILRSVLDEDSPVAHLVVRNCSGGLGELEALPRIKVAHLGLINCGVTRLYPLALSELSPMLTRLDLSRNEIAWFGTNFRRLKYLRWLDLSGNKIQSLPPHSLAPNKKLFFLNLNDNRLTRIPNLLYDGSPTDSSESQLTVLLLAGNRLKEFPAEVFTSRGTDLPTFPNLVYLDLSHNHFEHLNATGLGSGYQRLAVLKMANSSMTSVSAGVLAGLPALEVLDLAANRLSVIGDLFIDDALPSLRYLHLDWNGLHVPDSFDVIGICYAYCAGSHCQGQSQRCNAAMRRAHFIYFERQNRPREIATMVLGSKPDDVTKPQMLAFENDYYGVACDNAWKACPALQPAIYVSRTDGLCDDTSQWGRCRVMVE